MGQEKRIGTEGDAGREQLVDARVRADARDSPASENQSAQELVPPPPLPYDVA